MNYDNPQLIHEFCSWGKFVYKEAFMIRKLNKVVIRLGKPWQILIRITNPNPKRESDKIVPITNL